jgi:hypothetical protein
MAIAHQSAMPQVMPETRPRTSSAVRPAPAAWSTRHTVLSPVPEPRVAGVLIRIAALLTATAVAIGVVSSVVLAFAAGALNQLGH